MCAAGLLLGAAPAAQAQFAAGGLHAAVAAASDAAPAATTAVANTKAQAKPAMAITSSPAGSSLPAGAAADTKAPGKAKGQALAYGGFTIDYSISDSSTLNTLNYSNGLANYFEPAWAVGARYLKGTPFSKLSVSARVVLTDWLASYDPSTVTPGSDLGYAPRCSDIQQSSAGVTDPNSVQRCPTSANHRWLLDDTWLVLSDPGVYTIPGANIKVSPTVKLVLPTSLASQYATLRLTTGASVGLSRTFLGDKLKVGFTFGASKNFHGSTAPQLDSSGAPVSNGSVTGNYQLSDVTSDSADFYLDPSRQTPGGLNASWGMSEMLGLGYSPLKKLSFSALYVLLHSFSYDATASGCLVEAGGTMVDSCQNANDVAKSSNGVGTSGGVSISDTQVFWVTANYQLYPWVGISLAWITGSPLRHPDNSLRQPFISTDYNAFTQVSLGATFSFPGSTD